MSCSENNSQILQRLRRERLLYRLLGVRPDREMTPAVYSASFGGFGVLSAVFLFVLLLLQRWLPGGPEGRYLTTSMTPDLAANTAVSFATTTTWQAYGGESTMRYLLQLIGLTAQNFLGGAAGLAVGIAFLPASEKPKMIWSCRIYLAVVIGTIALAIALHSFLPLMFVWTPRFYGGWLHQLLGLTQHAGLAVNVKDHRLNTRTVKMCRLNRFLYWNMNYHVEHHMFPMVPYYRLPELHEEIKHDCAPVYPSLWAAYKEIVPAVLHQLRDQEYYVRRELLPGAAAFNEPTPVSDGRARPLTSATAA